MSSKMFVLKKTRGLEGRFRVDAACVIGRMGPLDVLDERLRAREVPSDRKPVADFAFAGDFPA